MKLRFYHILSDLFTNEIRTLLCLPLGITLLQLSFGRSEQLPFSLLLTLILGVVLLCFIYTVIRACVHIIIPFFLLHALIAGAAILLCFTSSIPAVILIGTVFVVLETIASIRHRLRAKAFPDNASPMLLILLLLAVIVGAYFDLHMFDTLFAVLLGICILMYLFNIYMLNFLKYAHIEENKRTIPYRRITGTYHMLLGIFSLAAIAVMFIARFLPLGSVLGTLGDAALTALRFLVKLFSRDKKEIPEEELTTEATTRATQAAQTMIPKGNTEPWWIWEFLQEVLFIVGKIAIVVGIAAGIAYAIYQIYKYFYAKNMAATDKTESLLFADTSERFKRQEATFHNLLRRFFPRTHSERIRRDFTRLVETQNTDINPTHTPRELLKQPDKTEAEALASLYSQARYSDKECTKEDSDRFKTLSKQYSK